MPKKKTVPPAEKPETKAASPAPEAEAPEMPPMPPDPTQSQEAPDFADPGGGQPPAEPETPPMPPSPTQGQEAPDFADPGGQAPARPETPPLPEGRPAVVTAAKGLNLREGPSFGFEVRTALKSGTVVLILDLPMGAKVPGWALVDAGEMTGWASEKHLRVLVD